MADPVVGITNGVPTSGTGTITTLGQTLLDGAQVTQGAIADAAVTAGATGTVSAKLRAISRDIGALVTGTVLAAGAAIIGKVGIDQTTDGTTNKVRAILHDGTTAALIKAASSGAAAASDPAIVVTLRDVNSNGGASVANSAPVVPADQYSQYETVAASATAQALGATGAAGDYLAGVLVFPAAAGCGVVTILDGAITIGTFAGGGTTALPSLVPFMIPIGLFSVSGAWKITTGASVAAVGIGKFT